MNQKSDQKTWKEWLLSTRADLALLQEAKRPPGCTESDPGGKRIGSSEITDEWKIAGYRRSSGRATVVRLSNRVRLTWHEWDSFSTTEERRFHASRLGTIALAEVDPQPGLFFDGFLVVSMYAVWENYHQSTDAGCRIFADASAHRLISDLSVFRYPDQGHRVIAAGDLNVLHGYGESGSDYWASRYDTVFARMRALGLDYAGPWHPNGRQADPWPSELPRNSLNVPTQCRGGAATRQMDFAFASKEIADSVKVQAMHDPCV